MDCLATQIGESAIHSTPGREDALPGNPAPHPEGSPGLLPQTGFRYIHFTPTVDPGAALPARNATEFRGRAEPS